MKEPSFQKTYWQRYIYLNNKERKYVFKCGCGKQYACFPSLYLHCLKKHKLRISTKPSKKQCNVFERSNKIIMQYILSEGDNKANYSNHQESIKNKSIEQPPKYQSQSEGIMQNEQEQSLDILKIIEMFKIWTKKQGRQKGFILKQYVDLKIFQEVMDELPEYLKINIVNFRQYQSIQFIPFHINGFIAYFINKNKGEDQLFSKTCSYLAFFGKWLFDQEYCQYKMVPFFEKDQHIEQESTNQSDNKVKKIAQQKLK